MKVKTLIKRLQQLDQELIVQVKNEGYSDGEYYCDYDPVDELELYGNVVNLLA